MAVRVFKKYTNRRLYCVKEGRYVVVADIANAVMAGEDIKVIAHGDQKDITASVLCQAVAAMIDSGAAVVRAADVAALIRKPSRA